MSTSSSVQDLVHLQQRPLFQGVLCPNGCELKTALLKQERSVRTVSFDLPPGSWDTSKAQLMSLCLRPQAMDELQPRVDALARSSNTVYEHVRTVSSSLRERQSVIRGLESPSTSEQR